MRLPALHPPKKKKETRKKKGEEKREKKRKETIKMEEEVPPADLLEATQVEDRVTDQLSRAMEGDEAASAAAVDVGAQQT